MLLDRPLQFKAEFCVWGWVKHNSIMICTISQKWPFLFQFLLFSGFYLTIAGATATAEEYSKKGNLSILLVHSYFPSHIFPLISLGAELVSRGHTVSCIGSIVEGYEHIRVLAESYGIKYLYEDKVSKQLYEGFRETGKHDGETSWVSLMVNLTQFILTSKEENNMQTMVRQFKTINVSQYDYIIVEQAFGPVLFHLRTALKANNTMLLMILSEFVSRSIIPWPYPRLLAPLTDNMSFTDRLLNTALYLPIESFMMIMISIMTNALDSDLSMPIDFLSGCQDQPVLYNTVIGFEWPKPSLPLQHFVGPMFPPNPFPLDPSLSEWLKKGDSPIIFISMGTTAIITRDMAQALITLSSQFRLVWSLRESNYHVLSGLNVDNNVVYITPWLSQFTMLQYPLVEVAILHCGMNGVHEALYNKVPVLCLPFGMDQYDVALHITHQKLGLSLQPQEVNQDSLAEAVQSLQEPVFQANVKKISLLFKAAGGAKKGADLVEFYAAYGYHHGLPAFIRYKWSFIQYYNIDVWIVLISILILLLLGIRNCCYCFCYKRCFVVAKFKGE